MSASHIKKLLKHSDGFWIAVGSEAYDVLSVTDDGWLSVSPNGQSHVRILLNPALLPSIRIHGDPSITAKEREA